ncbi:MAG: glycosyltransferase family 4 protein [Firmicutes bacterium]|nr:glycosyltransferase family 4 protein [Bacillota bacterium]
MRIWIINPYALPPSEPGGTRHYSLARELRGRGHEVLIIASNFNYNTRREINPGLAENTTVEIDSVPFTWVPVPGYHGNTRARVWNMLAFARKVLALKSLEAANRPDVIIASSPHLFGAWAAERLAHFYRVPFILEVRDLWPQTFVELGGFSPRHPFILVMSWIEGYLYRRADRIITLLPKAGDYISGFGIPRERVVWVPNGIDLALGPEPAPPVPGEKLRLIYTGAHGLANSLDTIIEAARILESENWSDRISFRFVGDGPEKPRLRKIVEKLGLSSVEFEDPVSKERVPGVLQEADACVAVLKKSSLYRWGMSLNKLFDYLAAGRPVILGTGAVNDPVRESGGGISVPAEDPGALARAIKEVAGMTAEERWEMGMRGRRYVEGNYSFKHLADKLEEVLCESIDKKH